MLRLIVIIPFVVVIVPLLMAGLFLLLAIKGDPGDCGGGRNLQIDPALAQTYEDRWVALNAQLTTGRPASFTVTDSEATSQARLFLAETGAPITHVRVCFVPAGGDVNGTLSPPFGPDLAMRVRGSVDLTGRHPRASINSVRIGAMPSFVARPFLGIVSRLVDEQTNQIELDHRIGLQLSDGQAVVSGQP